MRLLIPEQLVGAAAEQRQRSGEAASGASSGSEKVEAVNILIISDAILTLVRPRRHADQQCSFYSHMNQSTDSSHQEKPHH